jgi:hypothetical protein
MSSKSGDACKNIVVLKRTIKDLKRENRTLAERARLLSEALPYAISAVRETLGCYKDVRTGGDIIRVRAKEAASRLSACAGCKEHQDFEKRALQADVYNARQESFLSTALLVGRDVGAYFEKQNGKLEGIPIFYYDFPHAHVYSTHAAFDLVGTPLNHDLSLKGLLGFIGKDCRKEVEDKIKAGKGLRNYPLLTKRTGDLTEQALSLTSYPFYHRGRNTPPYGVLVFLAENGSDPSVTDGIYSEIRRLFSRTLQDRDKKPV